MNTVVQFTHTITDNFARCAAESIGDELLLFTLADGSTVTSVYLPYDHTPGHVYRITGPSGAILGEFNSLRPLVDLVDVLGGDT